MILLMLKYVHADTYTKYVFCFLCAFSLVFKFTQCPYIAHIIMNIFNLLHTFERWEVLRCDFLGSGKTSSSSTGIVQP